MQPLDAFEDIDRVTVPRFTRFPVEVATPPGFDPDDLATWPRAEGRLEYVGGRLLYMPPCGEPQTTVTSNVTWILGTWIRERTGFRVGSNEAGMMLGADRRGADAAIWRTEDIPKGHRGFIRVAPLLAVEVAGLDDMRPTLEEKARWYLDVGVRVVWLVFPDDHTVQVITRTGRNTFTRGQRLPENPALPGLAVPVDEFFRE